MSDQLLSGIGLVVWSWAMMESCLLNHLILMSAASRKSAVALTSTYMLTAGMTPRTVLGLLRSFIFARFKEADVEEFDKIRNRVNRLGDKRDLIAHLNWRIDAKKHEMRAVRIKSLNKVSRQPYTFTPRELIELADHIRLEAKALTEFFQSRGIVLDVRQTDGTSS
jgi:hypothetical protein